MNKKRRESEKGLTTLGTLLTIMFVAAIYLAYIYTPVLIKYYKVKEVLNRTVISSLQNNNHQLLQARCEEQLSTIGVDFKKGACNLEKDEKIRKTTASLTYNHRVNYPPTVFENNHEIQIKVSQNFLGK